jgi:hypothetical protein
MKNTIKCLKQVKENNFDIIKVVDDQGMELSCAIKQPIPTQNQFGSVSLIEHSCNSRCIFFNIDIKDGGFPYFSCKNSHMDEELALIYTEKPAESNIIISDL